MGLPFFIHLFDSVVGHSEAPLSAEHGFDYKLQDVKLKADNNSATTATTATTSSAATSSGPAEHHKRPREQLRIGSASSKLRKTQGRCLLGET